MKEKIEALFCRWIEEVWNEGNENAIEELFDENGVADYQYGFKNKLIHGKVDYKKFVRLIRGFFTDIKITIEQITSTENKVIAFCIFAANLRSIGANDFPTQSPVEVSGLCQVILENGKIIRLWSNMDLFGATEKMELKVAVNSS